METMYHKHPATTDISIAQSYPGDMDTHYYLPRTILTISDTTLTWTPYQYGHPAIFSH